MRPLTDFLSLIGIPGAIVATFIGIGLKKLGIYKPKHREGFADLGHFTSVCFFSGIGTVVAAIIILVFWLYP